MLPDPLETTLWLDPNLTTDGGICIWQCWYWGPACMYAVCKLFSQLIYILDYNLCIAAICFPVIWDKAKCEVRVFQKWIEVKMNSFDSKCCINWCNLFPDPHAQHVNLCRPKNELNKLFFEERIFHSWNSFFLITTILQ